MGSRIHFFLFKLAVINKQKYKSTMITTFTLHTPNFQLCLTFVNCFIFVFQEFPNVLIMHRSADENYYFRMPTWNCAMRRVTWNRSSPESIWALNISAKDVTEIRIRFRVNVNFVVWRLHFGFLSPFRNVDLFFVIFR